MSIPVMALLFYDHLTCEYMSKDNIEIVKQDIFPSNNKCNKFDIISFGEAHLYKLNQVFIDPLLICIKMSVIMKKQ